jgi:hypothetical protein
LALYFNCGVVRALYAQPAWLWFACPLLRYWQARLWTLVHRGRLPGDPVLFALRDPVSMAVGIALVAALVLAVRA